MLFESIIKSPSGQEQKNVNATETDVVEKNLNSFETRNIKKQKGFISYMENEYPYRGKAHYLRPEIETPHQLKLGCSLTKTARSSYRPAFLFKLESAGVELIVHALLGNELVVAAALNDPAVV